MQAPATAAASAQTRAGQTAQPQPWQVLARLVVGSAGASGAPAGAVESPPLPPEAVARLVLPELRDGPIAAAEATARAHRPLVRPLVATLAFSARARAAWSRAAARTDPGTRAAELAEGAAWATRAVRAARGLLRVLPPPTDDDRALRALIRTALGALVEAEPGQLAAVQALDQLASAARAMARLYGVPVVDPLGPSGRSDVPGFLSRLEEASQRGLAGVLSVALPALMLCVGLVFGALYLALSG